MGCSSDDAGGGGSTSTTIVTQKKIDVTPDGRSVETESDEVVSEDESSASNSDTSALPVSYHTFHTTDVDGCSSLLKPNSKADFDR